MGERVRGAEGRVSDELYGQLLCFTEAAQSCGLDDRVFAPALAARIRHLHIFLRDPELVELASRGLDTRLPFVLRTERAEDHSRIYLGRLDNDGRTTVGEVPFPILVAPHTSDTLQPYVPVSWGVQGQPMTGKQIGLLQALYAAQCQADWWPVAPPDLHLVAPEGIAVDQYRGRRWRIIGT
jgi:hypothetical protein